jgi:hypothetical protein
VNNDTFGEKSSNLVIESKAFLGKREEGGRQKEGVG